MNRIFFKVFFSILMLPFSLQAQQIQSTVIKGTRYTGHLDIFGFYLIAKSNDTVLNLQESFFEFKFKDFNNDGYKDLYLDWGGNIPERYTLYLFVPSTGKFKELKNFSEFPDAKLIKGTNYYYSYSRGGCADDAW